MLVHTNKRELTEQTFSAAKGKVFYGVCLLYPLYEFLLFSFAWNFKFKLYFKMIWILEFLFFGYCVVNLLTSRKWTSYVMILDTTTGALKTLWCL